MGCLCCRALQGHLMRGTDAAPLGPGSVSGLGTCVLVAPSWSLTSYGSQQRAAPGFRRGQDPDLVLTCRRKLLRHACPGDSLHPEKGLHILPAPGTLQSQGSCDLPVTDQCTAHMQTSEPTCTIDSRHKGHLTRTGDS